MTSSRADDDDDVGLCLLLRGPDAVPRRYVLSGNNTKKKHPTPFTDHLTADEYRVFPAVISEDALTPPPTPTPPPPPRPPPALAEPSRAV